jgi:hypothetical protein
MLLVNDVWDVSKVILVSFLGLRKLIAHLIFGFHLTEIDPRSN